MRLERHEEVKPLTSSALLFWPSPRIVCAGLVIVKQQNVPERLGKSSKREPCLGQISVLGL